MTLFEPIDSKIFKTRGPLDPVTDHAIIVPRPELDNLLRAAQATTVDAYIAILSSRQTGKTTLLYQLRHRLRPRGYGVALIDLAVVRDQPAEQLYRFVASGMRSELEPILPRIDTREALPLPSNPLEFRRFALNLARQARTPRIVVLIDEVEAVPDELADAFFGTIRNIFSSRRKEDEVAFEKYLVVLCGAKELHRLSSGPNSPLNIADRIYPQDFDVAGVQVLVDNLNRAQIKVPAETAQWVHDQTHGHPYLTQKLCAIIEQQHPDIVTPDIVARAADEILRSDDHLEKMIFQIDSEPGLRDQLEKIVSGETVMFSRLNSAVARLELAGAVRDEQKCLVRNEIYCKAFRAHLNIKPAPPPRPKLAWQRVLIATIAVLVFLINVPVLFSYVNDIVFTQRAINEKFEPADLNLRAIVHYDRILVANNPKQSSIDVELDQLTEPVIITFRPEDPDIVVDGNPRRKVETSPGRERYNFVLNQMAIPYNPFQPNITHRRINLIFESASGNKPSHTYTADFLVDYYSAVVISMAISFAGIIAFLAGLWGNVQRLRDAATIIGKLGRN